MSIFFQKIKYTLSEEKIATNCGGSSSKESKEHKRFVPKCNHLYIFKSAEKKCSKHTEKRPGRIHGKNAMGRRTANTLHCAA